MRHSRTLPPLRPILVLAATATAAVTAVAALAVEPSPGAGRYELQPNEAGFVRLDTVTGALSHCRPDGTSWTCERLDDPATDARLEVLAGDLGKLKTAVADLAARVDRLAEKPAAEPPEAAVTNNPPPLTTFARGVVDRFLAMVRLIKHGSTPAV